MENKRYLCRYNTTLECDGKNCDNCHKHPMYLKGINDILNEIVWTTKRDEFYEVVEELKKLSERPYMGLEEERTLKTVSTIMDRIQKQISEVEEK